MYLTGWPRKNKWNDEEECWLGVFSSIQNLPYSPQTNHGIHNSDGAAAQSQRNKKYVLKFQSGPVGCCEPVFYNGPREITIDKAIYVAAGAVKGFSKACFTSTYQTCKHDGNSWRSSYLCAINQGIIAIWLYLPILEKLERSPTTEFYQS